MEFPRSFGVQTGLFGPGFAAGAERELDVACGLAGVRVGVEAQPVREGADGGGRVDVGADAVGEHAARPGLVGFRFRRPALPRVASGGLAGVGMLPASAFEGSLVAGQVVAQFVEQAGEAASRVDAFGLEPVVERVVEDPFHEPARVGFAGGVEPFDELLVDLAEKMDATVVIKGLRAITDFEYEFQMTALNYQLNREIETLFIMSPPQYMYLSSSIVREIASLGGDVTQFVPPCVNDALNEKFGIA